MRFNLIDYSITSSGRKGDLVNEPEAAAQLYTGSQLGRFAANLGLPAFPAKTGRLAMARKIFARLAEKETTSPAVSIKKNITKRTMLQVKVENTSLSNRSNIPQKIFSLFPTNPISKADLLIKAKLDTALAEKASSHLNWWLPKFITAGEVTCV